jgi:hypothetical protein
MELYQEEQSIVQHLGMLYCVNKLIQFSEDIVPTNVLLHQVTHNLVNELDPDRVLKTDIKIPVIGIKENNKIFILDGEHRITKLQIRKAAFVRVKFITTDILNACKI